MAARPLAVHTSPVMLKRWFHRVVLSRRWLTFLVMGLAFFVFGAGTYNLVMLLKTNLALISAYGWQALMDGAARQLVELVVTGYLSLAAYVVFKTCEHRLTHELSESNAPHRVPDEGPRGEKADS
jgi:hypothetical protein